MPVPLEEGFVDEIPEDELAREEMLYGDRAKCPARGRRDKFEVRRGAGGGREGGLPRG